MSLKTLKLVRIIIEARSAHSAGPQKEKGTLESKERKKEKETGKERTNEGKNKRRTKTKERTKKEGTKKERQK